jgi:hypothetical protein
VPPPRSGAIDPEEILSDLLGLDTALQRERYYGERAIFYNPGRAARLGGIVAGIQDHNDPNDRSSRLWRADGYRFAFGISPGTFARRFGEVPPRPPKGETVALPGHDLDRVGELTPHPVYAWNSWVQILAPTRAELESLQPLLAESLDLARIKWRRRGAG